MNKWSFGKKFFVLIFLLIIVGAALRFFTPSFVPGFEGKKRIIPQKEILHLEITGVIMNGKKFLNNLKKYADRDSVKAILIEINSPGGAVGPSQELYYEILRAKKETKKPVICVSTSLIASGGYYAAMACDKLIVTPGAMVGSIGVIMEFANLEDLYGWAKIKRFSIKSGKFKDSGAEYREMREDEKELFQDMIDEVYMQFKSTVMEGRQLPDSVVSKYADGRVMTGAKAVELKFADQVGTFNDAVELAASMAKLGAKDDYELFKPRREQGRWFDYLIDQGNEEDDLNSQVNSIFSSNRNGTVIEKSIDAAMNKFLQTHLLNRPLYLMPGYWQ